MSWLFTPMHAVAKASRRRRRADVPESRQEAALDGRL